MPLLAGLIFQQFYNLVDTMIVGRTLGLTALAGVGATGALNFMVLGFCIGLCSGFAIPIARAFGADNISLLHRFEYNGIVLCSIFALVLTLVTTFFCRPLLVFMGTPADCLEEASSYLFIIFAGIPVTCMYNLASGYLQSLGDSRTPFLFLVLSSVLNVFLDYVLITKTSLGVAGASLATVIAQGISAVLCVLWIILRFPILHFSPLKVPLRLSVFAELCHYGLPMGLQYTVTAVGSMILQMGVNTLGSDAVASMTAATKISNFLSCPTNALGTTMATYCAQNVGAGKLDRLNRGTFSACLLGFGYSVIAFLIAFFASSQLTAMFITGDNISSLLSLSRLYLLINTASYPLLTMVNVLRFSIQGMGYSTLSIFSGVMELIARAICGIMLIPAFGFPGCCFGSPLAWLFADFFLLPAFFLCQRRLKGRVTPLPAVSAEISEPSRVPVSAHKAVSSAVR